MAQVWQRYQLVDYTTNPIGGYELCWKTRKPQEVTSVFTLFTAFDLLTWLAMVTVATLAVATLILCDVVHHPKTWHKYLFENFSMSLVALWQESLPHTWFRRTNRASKYVMLVSWLMLSLVLGLAFECNLFVILATKR